MTRTLRRVFFALAALAFALPVPAPAALPPGYQFSGVLDAVPAGTFRNSYGNQVLSVGTALNSGGTLFGFWLRPDGHFHSYSLKFGTNPVMTSLDTPDFVSLAGGESVCFWIFCSIAYGYGVQIDTTTTPPTGSTAFVNTPSGTAAIPGSLPFSMYPGNFVDENHNGVVASTQIDAAGNQFGALIYSGGVVTLADVPWLIAIDELAQPLVLAYDGQEGDCLVFGNNCAPDPADCTGDGTDTHTGLGRGHEEHGQGYGYGHDKCPPGPNGQPLPENQLRAGLSSGGAHNSLPPSVTQANASLLIRLMADGSTLRYRFPSQATDGTSNYQTDHVFPLALNDSRAILRGNVVTGNGTYDKLLLSCVFDPNALDPDGDGVVNCTGGLTVLGGVAGRVRVGTVLGFTLNNNGVLAGNLGYSAAGIGAPFVLDVTATAPVAQPLGNLSTGADAWEINALTDMNAGNKLTGYGYRDCAANPEAFFLNAVATAPAGGALQFGRGAFEFPALLQSGNTLAINPTLSGGSGNYEFRVSTRKPSDTAWSLLSDWSSSAGTYSPGSYLGDVCLRVEARDTTAPASARAETVRYRVVSANATTSGESSGTSTSLGVSTNTSFRIGDLLSATGLGQLLTMAVLLWRRRRRQ